MISIEPSLIYIKSFGQPGLHNKETLSRTKQNPNPVGRGREQAYVLPELSQRSRSGRGKSLSLSLRVVRAPSQETSH